MKIRLWCARLPTKCQTIFKDVNSRNQFEKTQTLLCVALQCYVFVYITMINKISNVRKKERKNKGMTKSVKLLITIIIEQSSALKHSKRNSKLKSSDPKKVAFLLSITYYI